MNTGQVISGAGHLGLIGWALLGGLFSDAPMPFEVTEVTAISAEDYAALVAPQESPDAVSDVVTPDAPEIDDAAPDMAASEDAAPDDARPDPAEPAEPDTAPEIARPAPLPEAEVSDAPPELSPPQEDVAVLAPDPAPRPKPRPAPRVAPEPVAPPEPDVRVDDVARPEVAPEEEAETVQEEQEASSPEEATTEIVTEAEEDEIAAAVPPRSVRPRSRPARPAAQAPEPEPQAPAAEPETDTSAVGDALAEALGAGGSDTTPEPTGPPMTAGEKDALRVAVENCWNVGSLSSEALRVTVVVGVKMNRDGTPDNGSIRMLSSDGGSGSATKQAFEAARRAIIRCGTDGYDLPVEKYDRWRDIEMTFNPEKMRIK